jgi:hypothetical protein
MLSRGGVIVFFLRKLTSWPGFWGCGSLLFVGFDLHVFGFGVFGFMFANPFTSLKGVVRLIVQ